MDKRSFLRTGLLATATTILNPFKMFSNTNTIQSTTDETFAFLADGPFKLPDLPYQFSALEPHIDAMTMEIHHDKHHAKYVNELNMAVEKMNYKTMKIEQVVETLKPTETKIRNNGGGHLNHSMFWKMLRPADNGMEMGKIGAMVTTKFGSMEKFKEQFNAAATTRFGSGWAWLIVTPQGGLAITSTANQDNPMMKNVVGKDYGYPILGLDVWEHAYYLKYQNRRPEYIGAFWNIINWEEVNANYNAGMKKFGKKV